jgi:hypothetical protein
MPKPKEPMTTKDAMKIVYFFTVIAAIPVGIWSYKFADNWFGAIAWFVTVELVLYFAAVFVLAVIVGLSGGFADENPETK